jgi:plasmid stabilization system protein ParE
MRIRYLPRAHADLEAIYIYITNRSPQAADRVLSAIIDSIDSLGDFPEIGVLADESAVRVLNSAHHTYRIYYSIVQDHVQILHVRHTSRKPPTIGEL